MVRSWSDAAAALTWPSAWRTVCWQRGAPQKWRLMPPVPHCESPQPSRQAAALQPLRDTPDPRHYTPPATSRAAKSKLCSMPSSWIRPVSAFR